MPGPFDRFNDRAKRVLALAQDEAIRFNHNYIGVEHLLLGLMREGEGVAARALNALGADLSKLRTAVEFMIGRGEPGHTPSEIVLAPRVKKVIELAVEEARKLGHSHVGTEHLLLGLVREGESVGVGMLESIGISRDKVRAYVASAMEGHPEAESSSARWALRYGVRKPSADDVIRIATDEARGLGHDWLGTEHLLLGVTKADGTNAQRVLADRTITYDTAKAEVVKAVPARATTVTEITLSPRAHTVLGYAQAFGDASGRGMSAETILLGLVAEPDGIAAQVISTLGATADQIRAALDRLLPPA